MRRNEKCFQDANTLGITHHHIPHNIPIEAKVCIIRMLHFCFSSAAALSAHPIYSIVLGLIVERLILLSLSSSVNKQFSPSSNRIAKSSLLNCVEESSDYILSVDCPMEDSSFCRSQKPRDEKLQLAGSTPFRLNRDAWAM